MRIVLTGFRGTGKTTTGRILGARLGISFIDTDQAIEERAGREIPAIFREQGEPAFRELERQVITSLPADGVVVSAGGGAVLDPVNVARLRRGSLVFLLQAHEEVISRRIGGSERPSLTGRPPAEEAGELLRARRPAYLRAADICIDTGDRSPEEVAGEILRLRREGPGSAGSAAKGPVLFGRLPHPAGDRELVPRILRGEEGNLA
ncbi:MAG: shikimate kinase, partial [Methanomicrobiales archaeon]|nr:shikimate kinase [Methanomicrobiales archaeon]